MFHQQIDTLIETLKPLRASGKKLVFTNGCFDILHIGHVRYLQEAKKCGDILVVALNSDASVRNLKGPTRPLQNEQDRAEILDALNSVDHTLIFDQATPLNVIKTLAPDVLVKGGDWPIEQIVGSEFVLSQGGQVKSLNFVEGRSTTNVVEKIKSSDLKK